jgi:16S rRNA (uracil1498-N3)-methyltransferase
MHRFFLPPKLCSGPSLTLSERESRHAAGVLRVREGEVVSVLDGAGREFQCAVRSAQRKEVQLEILKTRNDPPPPFSLTLIQAVPKGKLIEYIIQKATELGATVIRPILTERVASHLDGESVEQKAEKWRQTAIEAIKQCGQTWLPRVEPPRKFKDALNTAEKPELALAGALTLETLHPRECFDRFRQELKRNPRSVGVWIGPEGDFTPEEMRAILASGAQPVTFGPLVLRSETAALCALSIAASELRFPCPASPLTPATL